MGDGATLGFSNAATNAQGQSWGSTVGVNPVGTASVDTRLNFDSPAQLSTIFSNWMTGGPKPTAIDPSVGIAQAQAVAGQTRQGAQGMGLGGLFGLGKMNMFSPFQPGVSSSTPAMPSMPSGSMPNPFSSPGGR